VTALAEPLAHAAFASDEARCELVDLRTALARLDSAHTELAFYARALLVWHSRAQYCGSCGHATKPRDGGHMRLCSRGGCDTQHFPRTDPCVLVMVTDEDKVLLGRQKTFPRGMYSTLAGFVEAGETLEQAVAREVLEETGVVIEPESLRYAGSQPWPFPASLMIGFRARAARTEIVRGEELEEARWVSRGELEEQHEGFWIPPPLTLSGQLLAEFLAEKPAKLRD
jgi:NAD+ diphosphatase